MFFSASSAPQQTGGGAFPAGLGPRSGPFFRRQRRRAVSVLVAEHNRYGRGYGVGAVACGSSTGFGFAGGSL